MVWGYVFSLVFMCMIAGGRLVVFPAPRPFSKNTLNIWQNRVSEIENNKTYMSFQKPNQQQHKKDPILNHSDLVKNGVKLVTIKSVPKVITRKSDQKRFHMVTIEVNGADHTYFIPNKDIEDSFKEYVGKTVVLIASGSDKQGTATMEIQAAMVKGSELPTTIQQQGGIKTEAAQSSVTALDRMHKDFQHPKPEPIKSPEPKDREAKVFLCQAANLMRLCVKKANDIAVELDLPNEHRQGIASGLFIQADRAGHTFKMPIQPYTPEELGYGASRGESLKTPQPEEAND